MIDLVAGEVLLVNPLLVTDSSTPQGLSSNLIKRVKHY